MRFASLTTMIICAAAMAGVAIASDNLISPLGLLCDKSKHVGCSRSTTLNNGNDFGYTCGESGTIESWTGCSCKDCCRIKANTPFGYSCGPQ
ncbi:hypothetical protein EDB19DRAFT_1770638 [Suillus lakei]|nr:hypothetical protein EDB19DRAFT_1770638 [Suillus lakei]